MYGTVTCSMGTISCSMRTVTCSVYLWMLYALQVVSARTLRSQMPATLAHIYFPKVWAWITSYFCEIQGQSRSSELDIISWNASIVSLSVRWRVFRSHRLVTSSLRTADPVILFLVWLVSLERSKPIKSFMCCFCIGVHIACH